MAGRVSMATRLELVEAIVERYRSGCRADKQGILDEFVAVAIIANVRSGCCDLGLPVRRPPDNIRCFMAPKFLEALVALWKASDRLCSKRLKPLIPILLPALERHGRLDLDGELRDKLLTISAADGSPAFGSACCSSRGAAPSRRTEFCGAYVGSGAHLRRLE